MSDRFVSVTIPYGRGYEEPKITFHGSAVEVAADLVAAFGFTAEGVKDLTLHQIVFNASQCTDALRHIGEDFKGARAISSGSKGQKPAPTPEELLIAQIAAEDMTVEKLQRMWAEADQAGQSLTQWPVVVEAWNKRGMELTATS